MRGKTGMDGSVTRSFSISNIGGSYKKDYYSKRVIFDSHCHSSYEIILVLTGKITVLIEGREYVAQPNHAVILPPFVYHSILGNGRGDYERINLCFGGSTVPPEIRTEFAARVREYPLFVGEENARIFSLMRKMICEENSERFVPLFRAELTRLFYMISDGDVKGESVADDEADDTCAKIISYINENIESRITLDDISRRLFLSKSTVCHVFKDKMKISVKQYILQKKMSYATAQLRDGMPAGEVAKRVGYDNYVNFYNIYKKTTGVTPGEVKSAANE